MDIIKKVYFYWCKILSLIIHVSELYNIFWRCGDEQWVKVSLPHADPPGLCFLVNFHILLLTGFFGPFLRYPFM